MASRKERLSPARPVWDQLAGKFTTPRECLAGFIALEAAEVIRGVKPANLLSIANRNRACGRNLYELWRQYGQEIVAAGGLEVRELADRQGSLLLLIYDPAAMAALLARRNVSAFLGRAGYRQPLDMASALSDLEERLREKGFPHEIGVFLGYPLKDVLGFMGWCTLPFTCQGPWKIYGDPAASLALAEECRVCRRQMARKLKGCADPLACFGKTLPPPQP